MPPRPYQDNPFEPSHVDVDDYYGDVPPAHRLSAGLYPTSNTSGGSNFASIPLGATSQRYSQTSPPPAESTDSLALPSAPTPGSFSAGYGMYAGKYADLRAQKPGGYTPRQLPAKSNRKKWIIIGSLLAIAGIIIVGVVVGVVVSRNNSNRAVSGSSSNSSPSSGSPSPEDPNDPSKFSKNPAYHQSFYGIAYTPANSQLPDCGNSLSAVIADMQVMSQLTTRVRLYGADCNQSALVLEAIVQTKINMTVYLANYPIATDNGAAYQRQRDVIKQALTTYPTNLVAGVIVGNEFMLNYVTDKGISDTDINSPAANVGAAILVSFIQDTRTMLQGMGLGSIPIGNSDAGSYFNNEVLAVCDFGMANVHPWFADVTVQDSADWTYQFFEQNDVQLANNLTNKPAMYIAETGWPTNSSTLAAESNGASDASIPNLQIFLDTFICQANANGTMYFFFEFADEEWKNIQFGGVEGYWGLMNQNLTLKDGITIPNCQSP